MAAPGIAIRPLPPSAAAPARWRNLPAWRLDGLCALTLCVLTLLSWVPRWQGPIDLRWDGGTYFILGTSLAEGKGYRLLNEPGEIKADQYPPLLPAIVALHEKMLHSEDPTQVGIALRRTWILISLGYVVTTFLLARLYLSRAYSFWLAAVCMLSYDMYYLATLSFAELPFALVTVLFAWCYLRRGGDSWTRYLSPALAVAAYLLRSMGIALLLAWVGDALLRRQFRRALVRGMVAIVPVASWQTYVHSVEVSPEYQKPYYAYQRDPSMFYNVSYSINMRLRDPFRPDKGFVNAGDLVYRVTQNVIAIPSTLGQSITARQGFFRGHVRAINQLLHREVIPHWPYVVLLNVLGLMVILGILQLMRERQWLVACSITLTLAAICTTPWPGQFARYLAPILPLLLLALTAFLNRFRFPRLRMLQREGRWRPKLRLGVAAILACESCLALQSGNRNFLYAVNYRDAANREHSYKLLHYSPEYSATQEALRWLEPRAEHDAVVADTMPQWTYLQSGFKAVMPPLTTNPVRLTEQMDTVPVSFYIVEQLLMDDNFNTFAPKQIGDDRRLWKMVHAVPGSDVKVYARCGMAKLSGHVVTE